MAQTIFLRRTATGFVPDAKCEGEFEILPVGGYYKAVLTVPRSINDDNPTEEQRKVAQNRLYRMWLTDISRTTVNEFAGNTEDFWHRKFKQRWLVWIYERDSQDYAEMLQAVRAVKQCGMESEAKTMWKYIVNETSTTRASVSQFREYLNAIQVWSGMEGIWLRTDAWLYRLALEHYGQEVAA